MSGNDPFQETRYYNVMLEVTQPQSYLLPIQYIAAGDMAAYRNSPAFRGERNNLILVDYRSLGSTANDPLRRGREAAATASMAQGSQTILQTSNTGNTVNDLYANLGYENRNANVNYADESSGFDVSLPEPELLRDLLVRLSEAGSDRRLRVRRSTEQHGIRFVVALHGLHHAAGAGGQFG